MRVLTFNVHGWRTAADDPNHEAVARVIGASGADIVGLNEVYYPRPAPGRERPALTELAERLGMHFLFGPALRWPAQDDVPAPAFGNALLSRWPILAGAAHHLTDVPGKEERGLLEARILLPTQRSLTVYVTHLDHTDEDVRVTQLRALRTWTVRDRNRPHLILGDFNAINRWDFSGREGDLEKLAQHPTGQNLVKSEKGGPQVVAALEKAGYVDALTRFGTPGDASYVPVQDPPLRIDYIFVSAPLAPALTACRIWPEAAGQEASDHRPVLAEFDLDRIP
jgi:endonuclease/exonuclease/phosphatase family metal-dependent hydrolase